MAIREISRLLNFFNMLGGYRCFSFLCCGKRTRELKGHSMLAFVFGGRWLGVKIKIRYREFYGTTRKLEITSLNSYLTTIYSAQYMVFCHRFLFHKRSSPPGMNVLGGFFVSEKCMEPPKVYGGVFCVNHAPIEGLWRNML